MVCHKHKCRTSGQVEQTGEKAKGHSISTWLCWVPTKSKTKAPKWTLHNSCFLNVILLLQAQRQTPTGPCVLTGKLLFSQDMDINPLHTLILSKCLELQKRQQSWGQQCTSERNKSGGCGSMQIPEHQTCTCLMTRLSPGLVSSWLVRSGTKDATLLKCWLAERNQIFQMIKEGYQADHTGKGSLLLGSFEQIYIHYASYHITKVENTGLDQYNSTVVGLSIQPIWVQSPESHMVS